MYLHDTFTIKSYFSVIQSWSYRQVTELKCVLTSSEKIYVLS